METITIKRTSKGYWMKRFDDYERAFKRISKQQALHDITLARSKGKMFADDNEDGDSPLCFGYEN